jgi:hypothetical protein
MLGSVHEISVVARRVLFHYRLHFVLQIRVGKVVQIRVGNPVKLVSLLDVRRVSTKLRVWSLAVVELSLAAQDVLELATYVPNVHSQGHTIHR